MLDKMGRMTYKEGSIIGSCKLLKMLPSKIFGTQGRKLGMGLFECSICGNPFECMISSVKVSTKSCGCLALKVSSKIHTKHGLSRTKEYRAWLGIKTRCLNISDRNYPNWGGRGIKVSPLWENDFSRFLSDIGFAPSMKHSVDRIDNDGNYEPGNCRWATTYEQSLNRRGNRLITYNGETKTIMEWSEQTGISFSALQGRVSRGWEADDIFNKPITHSYFKRHKVRLKLKT